MDLTSSDSVEIVSDSQLASFRRAPSSTPPPTSASNASFSAQGHPLSTGEAASTFRVPVARPKRLAKVIELSDESGDEGLPQSGREEDDDDDEIQIVAGPSGTVATKTASAAPSFPDVSSDDLPPMSALWAARGMGHGPSVPRSASPNAGSSSLAPQVSSAPPSPLRSHEQNHRNPSQQAPLHRRPACARPGATVADLDISCPSPPGAGLSSSPPLPPPAALAVTRTRAPNPSAKAKGKQRAVLDGDASADGSLGGATAEADPWAAILGDEGDGADEGKGKEAARARKRVLDRDVGGPDDDGVAAAPTKRRSPTRKAPRLSQEDKTSKKEQAAADRAAKAALKQQETADRLKLREANTLKTKDKKLTAAELTVHISGSAFAPPADGESDGAEDGGAGGAARKKGRDKKKDKTSPWLEIARKLKERLGQYCCEVECPEVPRRDMGCEGAIRWTRVCDRVWDDGKSMYLPLRDGERIVVEEDSRLIFLTAHDLSLHIANQTLQSHIASLQAQLPTHTNLFILLFGLNSLFRDMERARQAEYRVQVRAATGDGEAVQAAKVKPPGIGETQPSKDELELELMRVQVKSRCMIVSVDKVDEAVDWLEQISFDVGQKPYQRHKHSHIALLGTSEDKIVSGKDLQDTYIKMLAALRGVTEPVAQGIAGEYPTLRELFEGWQRCRDEKERREMLVGIGKGRNINGTATHRAIGTTLSANVYRMLTSRDPGMFI
ncbi:hypothetical protein JCM21900_001537 [Sporobolomyces salmonicolor]